MAASAISSYMDISGLVEIQKTYLANLPTNTTGTAEVANDLQRLNSSINGVSTAIGNNSTAYILTGQNAVYDIVSREKNRLDDKSSAIRGAESNQIRIIELNNNYKKRYAAYTEIVIVIVAALVILLILARMRSVGVVPVMILNLVTSLVLVSTLIYCGRKYLDIIYRDRIYFDELDTNSPWMKSTATIAKDVSNGILSSNGVGNSDKYVNNISMGWGCFGERCCSTSTVWDTATNTCIVPPSQSGFTSRSSNTLPYATSEFSNYSRL
jgi:hypothetical protein